MGMSPKIQQVDPNAGVVKPLQGTQSNFLQAVYQGNNPFSSFGSPLQQQATNQMGQFLNQPAPESKTLEAAAPALQHQLGGDPGQFAANPFAQMTTSAGPSPASFGKTPLPNYAAAEGQMAANPFGELQNPFAQMGQANPGQAVVNAAQPLFARNLQAAQTQLGSAAPGRFSSAFVDQGQDLASQALQDFNLFQAQQLQAGQAQQLAQQQAAQQFLLGARGLQQQATQDARAGLGQLLGLQQQGALGAQQLAQQGSVDAQNLQLQNLQRQDQFNLGARELQQNAWSQSLAQQLGLMQSQQGAAGVLGQLSGLAGDNPFQRMLAASQLGLQSQQAQINPLLQLMLGGLQYAQPQAMDTIVGKSPFEQIAGLATGVGSAALGGLGMLHPSNQTH
jgi:hypothetical protein